MKLFSMLSASTALTLAAATLALADQAPSLQAQVDAGTLPPLEERLPENPVVLTPVDSIGTYGGTWRTALLGGGDTAWLNRTISYEHLVNWNSEFSDVYSNVAESYEISEDGKVISFKLREGVKWSDGVEYTTDDVAFFWNDLVLNDKINVPLSAWWRIGGELPAVEVQDKYNFTITFAQPNRLFVKAMAHPDDWGLTGAPAHYLKKFHGDHSDDADAVASAEGYDSWQSYVNSIVDGKGAFRDADWPVLWGWKLNGEYGTATTRLEAVRNPYYFKVDPEGNQLPYIDSVAFDISSNAEALLLRVLSGEIDMLSRHINNSANKPVLFDSQESGEFRIVNMVSTGPGAGMITVNMTHKDPEKREIFSTKDFRIALSLGINRADIIDAVFTGVGEPQQAALIESSQFYNEEYAKQYTEYDVARANELLDGIGLDERDAEGFRLMPSGKRLTIDMNVSIARPDWVDIMQFVQRDWKELGVELRMTAADRSLIAEANLNNDHDAAMWFAEGAGGLEPLFAPYLMLPDNAYMSLYGIGWAYARNSGPDAENAVQPPENIQAAIDYYEQALRATTDAELNEAMQKLTDQAADNFMAIGISTAPPEYGIVSTRLRNVQENMPYTYTWPTPAPSNPQTWYFEN